MGKLIIFEGLDGSGKGTQAELACQNLHSKGYDPLKISRIQKQAEELTFPAKIDKLNKFSVQEWRNGRRIRLKI